MVWLPDIMHILFFTYIKLEKFWIHVFLSIYPTLLWWGVCVSQGFQGLCCWGGFCPLVGSWQIGPE